VELGSVYGLPVEPNELIRAHRTSREFDPTRSELADPVVVTELNVEFLGKLDHEGIRDPGWGEPNREGPDLRIFLVLDDRSAAEICEELVAPAGSENRPVVIDQALDDLAKGRGEGVFPGDRERACAPDQDGVSVTRLMKSN
jgi:hypothetical protein